MGRLMYQECHLLDIADRLLSHLRVVIMNKLRRNEPFMLMAPHPEQGVLSIWMHPTTPLVLQFYGSRSPKLDNSLIGIEVSHRLVDEEGLHGAAANAGRGAEDGVYRVESRVRPFGPLASCIMCSDL